MERFFSPDNERRNNLVSTTLLYLARRPDSRPPQSFAAGSGVYGVYFRNTLRERILVYRPPHSR